MYVLVKDVLSYFLLLATYYNLCIARYTGSGMAIRGWTDPHHIGQVEYPYHGAFANKPPYGYNILRDPLWMNGRDLNSVSTCTKALGQPRRADCRVLIDRLDWVVVQAVYEQGVQTEHLEEKYITLPRIYSYQTCVVGLRIMPNPKYDLDVDIASEWVIREAAVRINYVCLRKTTATRVRPAANGKVDPRLLGLPVGGWQIQGLYKRINITIFEKSIDPTDSPGVEINSLRVMESCWYRRAMGISSETCSDTITLGATDEERDDDMHDENGPDSGGSGNGNAGESGAGASGGSDPGASGPGRTSNNPTAGGSEPGGGLWSPRSEWPLSCIVGKQPSFCAEGFQCVPKIFQSPNLQFFFGVISSAATTFLDKLEIIQDLETLRLVRDGNCTDLRGGSLACGGEAIVRAVASM